LFSHKQIEHFQKCVCVELLFQYSQLYIIKKIPNLLEKHNKIAYKLMDKPHIRLDKSIEISQKSRQISSKEGSNGNNKSKFTIYTAEKIDNIEITPTPTRDTRDIEIVSNFYEEFDSKRQRHSNDKNIHDVDIINFFKTSFKQDKNEPTKGTMNSNGGVAHTINQTNEEKKYMKQISFFDESDGFVKRESGFYD